MDGDLYRRFCIAGKVRPMTLKSHPPNPESLKAFESVIVNSHTLNHSHVLDPTAKAAD